MTRQEYLERVQSRLRVNFDVEIPGKEDGKEFLMIARYHGISGRIFLMPEDIIDKYEIFEICYMAALDQPSLKDIEAYFYLMAEKASSLCPEKDHFCTDITGILISESMPEETERLAKKLKFEKTFRLSWRGFSKVRLICVDLTKNKVYTNKAGKEIKKVYEW